jgi:hypothetical protein
VCGISGLSLVPSIPVCSMIMILIYQCVLWSWYPKGHRFDYHRSQANFSACSVWIYTQSNIKNIIFTWVHNIKTHTKNIMIIEHIGIDGVVVPTTC